MFNRVNKNISDAKDCVMLFPAGTDPEACNARVLVLPNGIVLLFPISVTVCVFFKPA